MNSLHSRYLQKLLANSVSFIFNSCLDLLVSSPMDHASSFELQLFIINCYPFIIIFFELSSEIVDLFQCIRDIIACKLFFVIFIFRFLKPFTNGLSNQKFSLFPRSQTGFPFFKTIFHFELFFGFFN